MNRDVLLSCIYLAVSIKFWGLMCSKVEGFRHLEFLV